MLTKIARDLTEEIKRQGLDIEAEKSIQHLERIVAEAVS